MEWRQEGRSTGETETYRKLNVCCYPVCQILQVQVLSKQFHPKLKRSRSISRYPTYACDLAARPAAATCKSGKLDKPLGIGFQSDRHEGRRRLDVGLGMGTGTGAQMKCQEIRKGGEEDLDEG